MPLPYSGIIPSSELSIEQKRAFRENALGELLHRAINVRHIGADEKEIVVRDILPQIDLGIGNDEWLTGAYVAYAAAAAYVNVALPADTMLVIYGVFCESAVLSFSVVYFRAGPGGATTRAMCQLESLYTKLESDGYLGKGVLWDPLETVWIGLYARLAVVTERLGFRGAIAEPVGTTVSGPVF